MSLKALLYAYVLGGFTFIPLLVVCAIYYTIYTSIPVEKAHGNKSNSEEVEKEKVTPEEPADESSSLGAVDLSDIPKPRKGWLTMRRTFEESASDGGYVTLVKSFLDARSKDPKRSRPKDMWYAVLKGKVLFLYEDETMTDCEAAVELGGHDVIIHPQGLSDGELFAKRNAICLRPKIPPQEPMPSVTRSMKLQDENSDQEADVNAKQPRATAEDQARREEARKEALNVATPWFIFVRSNIEMEDWYFALIHASNNPANSPTLPPLQKIFTPSDMNHLVMTLDEQPDVIPMRWLNAILGRVFFSYYRTRALEAEIIRRLMKKLSKVKRPAFLTDVLVTEVAIGNKTPTLSKPMLKELTKEGDASMEVHLFYKGEIRVTAEATATINLGARFKSYTVKLVLAAVLKEIEGNLLVKVKRPPSNRLWYAFTATPRMVMQVEPVVSDRQITWGMILSTIESRLREIIQESVVMPNMDDIAFFDSSPYQCRGGIWPDASRRERKISVSVDNEADSEDVTPEVEVAVQPPSPSRLRRAHSAENLVPEMEPPPLDTVPTSRSATASAPGVGRPPSPSLARRRRSSAFAPRDSGASDDVNGSDILYLSLQGADESQSKERHSANRLDMSSDMNIQEESPGINGPLSSKSFRRSSHSSASSSGDQILSSDPFEADPAPNSSSSAPSTPNQKNHQASRSAGNTPLNASTSSFLTKLKSRAGDKEALSRSAQEAMRKWGVNWGGSKKESNDGSPDRVFGDLRSRVDSTTLSQKMRVGYAEVRAAVTEKRAQAREFIEGSNNALSTSSVTVPQNVRGKERAEDNTSQSNPFEVPTPSGIVAPPVSRSNTHASNRSSELTPEVTDQESSASTPPTILHTQQPSGKTMTIPGIHASHRGEVMSMGYVAPPRPVPAPPSVGNARSPAIQTVYRLWNKQGQDNATEQGLAEADATVVDETEDSATEEKVCTGSTSVSRSPPRPPPLPPRSKPIAAPISTPQLEVPEITPESQQSSCSASETLKSIATRDTNRRLSLDQSGPSSPDETDVEKIKVEDVDDGEGFGIEDLPNIPNAGARAMSQESSSPPQISVLG